MSNQLIIPAAPPHVPIIAVGTLGTSDAERYAVAEQIGRACREYGFFYITGHGISERLQGRLEALSREFFAQRVEEKLKIRMELGGQAWRG